MELLFQANGILYVLEEIMICVKIFDAVVSTAKLAVALQALISTISKDNLQFSLIFVLIIIEILSFLSDTNCQYL